MRHGITFGLGPVEAMGRIRVHGIWQESDPYGHPPGTKKAIDLNDNSVRDYLIFGNTECRKLPDPLPGTESPEERSDGIDIRNLWTIDP